MKKFTSDLLTEFSQPDDHQNDFHRARCRLAETLAQIPPTASAAECVTQYQRIKAGSNRTNQA